LLVVIGIIALLIGILLPSLQSARRSAQRTACSAKLHNMILAATMHRNDHKDYYPLAGVLPASDPDGLDDSYSQKYDYSTSGLSASTRLLAPLTYALETEMHGGQNLYSPNGILGAPDYNRDVTTMLDPGGLLAKDFLCPAHASSPLDVQPTYVFMWTAGVGNYVCQPQSYIYNEFVLGWDDNYYYTTPLGYLRGKGSLVHKPTQTMFAADGLGGSTRANHGLNHGLANPIYTVYPNTPSPTTLADALLSAGSFAGDTQNFDKIRHQGKINIAFCDGHVETRSITAADLANIFISAP
jgi:prepilin-type processing-associated H-X9-DG protein